MLDQAGRFSGRLGRLGYLVWSLIATLFFSLTTWLGDLLVHEGHFFVHEGHLLGAHVLIALGWLLALAGMLLAFWIGAAAAVKRLHDLNLPWWHVAWILPMYLAGPILDMLTLSLWADLDKLMVLAVAVFLLLMPGQKQANRYG